ncbi:MAG: TIGR01459 family HAD-type hydrolase [Hyphomicrobiaceae bacterium]|nr:TIGR01459 family HAD-type hydrolase [Hyphomicrobiaceae bacterium]
MQQQLNARRVPPILAAAGPLLANYDVVFCDVWGVVHDGVRAFPLACEALVRFRARGGTVVLVSNAPVPQAQVARMLDSRKVPQAAFDAIVSSGDIALAHIAERDYRQLYCIGPADRDSALFAAISTRRAESLETADAILCSGLTDDVNETAETYRPLLERALTRKLPFVCANPDLVVDVGGRLYLCAGAIAEVYEGLGGAVYWAGKPHPSAYGTALTVAQELRGQSIQAARILAIGDAVRTDLKAAESMGIGALFIAAGIHRHETMTGDTIDPGMLAALFERQPLPALGAMPYLAE